LATVEMGLSEERFWNLPVPLLFVLQEAHYKSQYPAYWRMGRMCSIQINMNLKQGAKPYEPEDFIPAHIRNAKFGRVVDVVETPDSMKSKAEALTLAMGGKVIRKKAPPSPSRRSR